MSSLEITTAIQESIPKIRTEETSGQASNLMNAPVWLTKDYLENCLRTRYKDYELRIQRMDARPALDKGENYGGVLTRVKADFITGSKTNKTGHYIVKTSFEGDEFARKLMEPYDIFTREMDIYKTVLPKLNALLHEIGDTDQLFAETMAVDYERSALIFEDLSVRNFTTADRTKGLNLSLAKMALRKLAKMHATSAVLNEREQGCLEHYDRGMFNRYTENYAGFYVGLLEACSRRVKQWEEYKHYGEKLHRLSEVFMEYGKRAFDPVKTHINVLAHGDYWTNNIMVKCCKNTGKSLDVIMIDFQYAVWTSPAVDLHYFLNTSLFKEDMQTHIKDELIQYYYEIFADTLFRLAYKNKIPNLHEFHLQMEEKAFYALSSGLIALAVHRNEETEDADFNALMKNDERAIRFKDSCYMNSNTQHIIKQLLPLFDRKGLLELNQ